MNAGSFICMWNSIDSIRIHPIACTCIGDDRRHYNQLEWINVCMHFYSFSHTICLQRQPEDCCYFFVFFVYSDGRQGYKAFILSMLELTHICYGDIRNGFHLVENGSLSLYYQFYFVPLIRVLFLCTFFCVFLLRSIGNYRVLFILILIEAVTIDFCK